jgi:acid phosphatase type 7
LCLRRSQSAMSQTLRSLAAISAVAFVACAASKAGDNGPVPMQLRLAYAGDTGMVVSWNTYSQLSRPTVRYGLSLDLSETAWSTVSVTYPTSTTYNNHVQLKDLKPNTLYYYQPEFSNSTTPYAFRTSRPAGDGTPYSIAVVVDLGTMGPDGLTTHVGKGAANPLRVNETNTIQSLSQFKPGYDFLWHG